MSLISNTPIFLTNLSSYLENPTQIKGVEFISPLALKALERLKDNDKSDSLVLENISNLEEIWIGNIQKTAENLPSEVTEELSNIFKQFSECHNDAKDELVLQLIKISQEHGIDLFKIFKDSIDEQEKLFEHLKLVNTKEIFNSSLKIKLCKKLIEWHTKTEIERVTIIADYYRNSSTLGLCRKKEDEIFNVRMKFFKLFRNINETIFSNNFRLHYYKNSSEFTWDEETKELLESNETCHANKMALEQLHVQEISNINDKYEILFKEAQQAKNEKILKAQCEAKKKHKPEKQKNHTNNNQSDISIDELQSFLSTLEQKEHNNNKCCIVL